MVNNIAGVSGCGSSMSDGMIPIGEGLTIPLTSAIRVVSRPWVSCWPPICMSILHQNGTREVH